MVGPGGMSANAMQAALLDEVAALAREQALRDLDDVPVARRSPREPRAQGAAWALRSP
jgi:hypothetical protein